MTAHIAYLLLSRKSPLLPFHTNLRLLSTHYKRLVCHFPTEPKHGRQNRAFYIQFWKEILSKGRWQGEIWNRRKCGEVFPEWLSVSTVTDNQGRITHYVGLFSDITSRKMAEDRLKHQAHHDPLTGLPNRLLFEDRLHQAIASAQRYGSEIALLYIDLDKFKPVNDTYGHEAGDMALRTVSKRLTSLLRASDTAARIGGDEFVALLPELHDTESVKHVARKILQSLAEPVDLGVAQAKMGASIGISFFPRHGENYESLMSAADTAMYAVKQSGRNDYCIASDP
ncbi:diguanylate cyclase domain-containing protein [Magnetofaba australis]|uniref:diguanylate cyclase domain-containing protein n=1 Tax=Magnetofaba australis TaxID=1472297 RepID=UPI0023B95B28|nr:diguanylate cyclase [Magnetofaba australis]